MMENPNYIQHVQILQLDLSAIKLCTEKARFVSKQSFWVEKKYSARINTGASSPDKYLIMKTWEK